MKRAAKVDINQKEIVTYLRKIGASVAVMSAVGQGFPDLVVGWRGRNYLIEIKQAKGKLTEDQYEFAAHWRGQYGVARCIDDACNIIGADLPRLNVLKDDE